MALVRQLIAAMMAIGIIGWACWWWYFFTAHESRPERLVLLIMAGLGYGVCFGSAMGTWYKNLSQDL